jgi:hypothetical protein
MAGTTDAMLRSVDVAARLGVSAADVYGLLFAGEVHGAPDSDGIVYFSEQSVAAYLERRRLTDTHPGSD